MKKTVKDLWRERRQERQDPRYKWLGRYARRAERLRRMEAEALRMERESMRRNETPRERHDRVHGALDRLLSDYIESWFD